MWPWAGQKNVTMRQRSSLRLKTTLKMSTTLTLSLALELSKSSMKSATVSREMRVPVRPTPAEQWTTIGDGLKIGKVNFCITMAVYVAYLQLVSVLVFYSDNQISNTSKLYHCKVCKMNLKENEKEAGMWSKYCQPGVGRSGHCEIQMFQSSVGW